jgi:hypothetical protein
MDTPLFGNAIQTHTNGIAADNFGKEWNVTGRSGFYTAQYSYMMSPIPNPVT